MKGCHGGIYWLASYPKSGNTWFRAFLHNLRADGDAPADINEIGSGPIASWRGWIDDVLGFDSADLTPEEVERLRPHVYQWTSGTSGEVSYHKIHDAYSRLPGGEPLVGAEGTLGAVYIARNPLDVVSSLACHMSWTVEEAITRMADPGLWAGRRPAGLNHQVPVRLSSWSGHVASWIDAAGLRCELVRYEDMAACPVETFTRAAAFLGLPADRRRVEKAVRFSAFPELRRQEQEHGFGARPPGPDRFFRQGQAGAWRDELTAAQVARVVASHGPMMRRLGYLESDEDSGVAEVRMTPCVNG